MVQIITKNVPYSSILVDRIEMSDEFCWLGGQKLTTGHVKRFHSRILLRCRIFCPQQSDSPNWRAELESDVCVRLIVGLTAVIG